jgi:hypothetical protein
VAGIKDVGNGDELAYLTGISENSLRYTQFVDSFKTVPQAHTDRESERDRERGRYVRAKRLIFDLGKVE